MRSAEDVFLEDVVGNRLQYISPSEILRAFVLWQKCGEPNDENGIDDFTTKYQHLFGY